MIWAGPWACSNASRSMPGRPPAPDRRAVGDMALPGHDPHAAGAARRRAVVDRALRGARPRALFFPLRRLFGGWLAAAMVLAVAWEPFHLALSRQLHPDGMLAAFTLLALLSFLAWLYGGRQLRYLLLSAVTMGLALLTKTPAGIAMVVAGLLILWEWWRLWRARAPGKTRLVGSFVGWGLLATAVFFVLWPALWLDPDHYFREDVPSTWRLCGRGARPPQLLLRPGGARSRPLLLPGGMALPHDAGYVRGPAVRFRLAGAPLLAAGQPRGAEHIRGADPLRRLLCTRHHHCQQEVRPLPAAGLPAPGHPGRAGAGGCGGRRVELVGAAARRPSAGGRWQAGGRAWRSGRGAAASATRAARFPACALLPDLLQPARRGQRHGAQGTAHRVGRGSRPGGGLAQCPSRRRPAARGRLVRRRVSFVLSRHP